MAAAPLEPLVSLGGETIERGEQTMGVRNLKIGETQEHKTARPKRRTKRIIVFFAAGAIVCIAIALVSHHLRSAKPQVLQSPAPPEMTVSVVHPEKVSSTVILDLPGQLQAYTDAPIFAQTSGYLKAWYFDIGAKTRESVAKSIKTFGEVNFAFCIDG